MCYRLHIIQGHEVKGRKNLASKNSIFAIHRSRGGRRFLLFLLLFVGILILGFHFWRHGLPRPNAPRIGISVSNDLLDRLGIHRGAYDHALSQVGAQVVTLAPGNGLEGIDELLDGIDGLLLTGGGDVHPQLYGKALSSSRGISLERDLFEIRLIQGALERDMPILGICRGHQILNVAHGGTLQDLKANEELAKNHGPSLKSFGAHFVKITANSNLAGIIGERTLQVNSFHLQAIAEVGEDLRVCAIAPDGVVEAVERTDRRMVIGIQWHPEIMAIGDSSHQAIFKKPVERARDYRASQT